MHLHISGLYYLFLLVPIFQCWKIPIIVDYKRKSTLKTNPKNSFLSLNSPGVITTFATSSQSSSETENANFDSLRFAAESLDKNNFENKLEQCLNFLNESGKGEVGDFIRIMNYVVKFGDASILHRTLDTWVEQGMIPTSLMMGRILHSASKARKWLLCVHILAWMRSQNIQPQSSSISQLVAEMAKNRLLFLVWELLKTEDIPLSTSIYNALISGCSKGKDAKKALLFFQEMKNKGIQRDAVTYGSVLGAVKHIQDVGMGFNLFEEMKIEAIQPDQYCYNILMALCSEAGEYDRALEVFEAMGADPQVERDVISFNTAITACERSGDDKRAIHIMNNMLELGVVPDAITFHSAISACGRARNWKDALKLFTKMDKLAVKKCTISYNAVISALTRSDEWTTALSLFEEMGVRGIPKDKITFGAALHAAMKGNKYKISLKLIKEMANAGIKPNTITFGTAIHTCVNAGQTGKALELYKDCSHIGVRPNEVIYQVLINGCLSSGMEKEAFILLTDMIDACYRINHNFINSMIVSAVKRPSIILSILSSARSNACTPSVLNYNAALRVICESKESSNEVTLQNALSVYSWMQEDQIVPNRITFSLISRLLEEHQQWQKLLQFLEQAKTFDLSDADGEGSKYFIEAVRQRALAHL